MDRQTDGQTDGIAIAYARLAYMLSRATSAIHSNTIMENYKSHTIFHDKIFPSQFPDISMTFSEIPEISLTSVFQVLQTSGHPVLNYLVNINIQNQKLSL